MWLLAYHVMITFIFSDYYSRNNFNDPVTIFLRKATFFSNLKVYKSNG